MKYNVHLEFKSIDYEVEAETWEEAEAKARVRYKRYDKADIDEECSEVVEAEE